MYWGTFTPATSADWFYKYAVQSVEASDPTGGSAGVFTSYQYAKPAWHYDDNEIVEAKDRTYGQWRGYQQTYTFTGTGTDPPTETGAIYYQGMSDDDNSTDVTIADTQLKPHEDSDQLAGDMLEQIDYDYSDTAAPSTPPVNNAKIYSYWVSAAAATRTRTGLPALTSVYARVVETWAEQEIADVSPPSYRITETDTTYDSNTGDAEFGQPEFVSGLGDVSQPSQATCTILSYAAANTSINLTGLVSETEVDAAACSGSSPDGISVPTSAQINDLSAPTGITRPADVISASRTFYDDPAMAATWPQPTSPAWPQAVPGNADVSVTQDATDYTGGAFTYQTVSARVYDSYGRVTSSYDGDDGYNAATGTTGPTTTSYTMTDGSATAETVTNPLSQATTTTYDPARGLPVTIKDPNGVVTTLQYDELGRLTSEWGASRPTSDPATVIYSYAVSDTAPTVVTTKKLDDLSGYVTSTALYDALLRVRQTQDPTPQGGMLVTDDFYDSRGFTWKTNNSWWDSGGTPGGSIVTVPDSQVPNQTVTQYDGLGRPVIVTSYDDSVVKSTAYTEYTGDKVITVPASGGTQTAVTTDALGRTTEQDSYTSAPTVTTGTNAGGFPTVSVTGGTTNATTDSYNTRGLLSTITAGGEQWTKTYNLLGQVTASTSPNGGSTTMTYDADGNLTSSTDADNHTITYGYDALGRETGEYDGSSTSDTALATWTYDNSNNVAGVTDAIGQLTAETSRDPGGDTFTIQQTGFNAFGESLGETVTVPTDQGALAGSYTLTHTYTPTTGLLSRDYYPASPAFDGVSALPAETVTHGYSPGFDLPVTLSSNLVGYAQDTTYTAWDQVAQEEIGSASTDAYITNTFDAHTGNLTDSQVANTAVSTTPDDDTSYGYDPSGNLTSESDTRTGTETELQCFGYNTLDQLAQAWTTNGSSACSAGPSTGSGGTVGDGISGSAYWTTWAYNALGDQTAQTGHSLTGGANTVTSYTYGSSTQPDTLTSSATTGGSTATASYGYDADGNTTSRDLPAGNQSLTWTHDGKLATDTTSAGPTSYSYDADGNLLAADDPGSDTLYIFGEQITATTNSSGTTTGITGIRFLPLPGGGQVVRTGAGSSYYFETTDQHGTSLLALSATLQSPVWRQETPFGAPRGTVSGTWPDTDGYLGKPTDANAGLTTVGARQYDTGLGRFLSVDPVLEAGDPSEMGGYAYAGDDPVSSSDPTGLVCAPGVPEGCRDHDPGDPDPPPPVTPGPGGQTGTGGGPSCARFGTGCTSVQIPSNPTTAQSLSFLAGVGDSILQTADMAMCGEDPLQCLLMATGNGASGTYTKVIAQAGVSTHGDYQSGQLTGSLLLAAIGGAASAGTEALDAAEDTGADAADAGASRGPSFVANSNGEVIRVPEGAEGPTPVRSGNGFQFSGGSGGDPLDSRVAGVRIMDPVTSGKYLYPDGYVSYFNEGGQPVNPFTGQTISPSDSFWHWAWGS